MSDKNDNKRYKEMEKRIALTHNEEWRNGIKTLKNFEYDKDYYYELTYKQEGKRKEESMYFDNVKYLEENQSFVFIRYIPDGMTGKFSEESYEETTLKDIEIIKIEKKQNIDIMSHPSQVSCIKYEDFR